MNYNPFVILVLEIYSAGGLRIIWKEERFFMNRDMDTDVIKRQVSLEEQIQVADAFINKNYLLNLSNCEVIPFDPELGYGNIRLFEVERFTFDEDENVNDKLISVYGALQEFHTEALLIIDGNAEGVTFYIGTRSRRENAARTAGAILEKSILGNFPGTILKRKDNSDIEKLMSSSTGIGEQDSIKHVATVTTVPAMRTEDKESFVQGIEKFIDTMICEDDKESYTAIIIAKPLEKEVLEQMKRGYEELYSTLSSYAGKSLAYGENESEAVSQGMFENFSKSINQSITNTTGENSSVNSGDSRGASYGRNYQGFFSGSSYGYNRGQTHGYSSGESWSKSVVEGTTSTVGGGTNTNNTKTQGSSKTVTVNFQNKSVQALMEKVEANLSRIRDCESFGLWQCAAYFVSSNVQTSVVAANAYRALMAGDNTAVENTYINQWSLQEGDNTKEVLKYLSVGVHPRFKISSTDSIDEQIVMPTNLISGKELPILMGFPQKSVAGLTIVHTAAFGRNIYENRRTGDQKKIRIGQIKHMGKIQQNRVELNLNSFTSHCFITGSTGSGKSNTSYKLLEQFYKNNVKFLVIEPAKGEYRKEFANLLDINILCTNPAYFRMLKINPFKFPDKIHVLEHLDRLIEIFNACWEMYAAMPAILKEAVEQAYIKTGWDLQNSIYRKEGEKHYPTFDTLLETLPEVIRLSDYSAENKGNYTGALVTRVKSLTNGISGQLFEDEIGIQDSVLFDENTIVDLSRIGSSETKSLIMGVLILKLNEYRMAEATETNVGLKHVTLMEEAHNLLRRCDGLANPVLAKSVEMISNSIAEMRTYGEGFVIVDQSPGAVDISAIKNTNTKIVMRLPDYDDCLTVGKAASLTDTQINEIARLGTGEAIITQNNWIEAVLTQIDEYKGDGFKGEDEITDIANMPEIKGKLLQLYFEQRNTDKYDFNEMKRFIMKGKLNRHKTAEIVDFWQAVYKKSPYPKTASGNFEFEKMIVRFLGCQNAFDLCPVPELEPEMTDETCKKEAIQWKKKFKGIIAQYVIFDDEKYISYVLKYLLSYKTAMTYKAIYNKIRNYIFS